MSVEESVVPQVNMSYVHLTQDGAVSELNNPITRYWAKLVPQFTLDPDVGLADLARLQEAFNDFCLKAWDAPLRRNPLLVDPYKILDGTEPVDTLETTLERLTDEYGVWPVCAAAEARKPKVAS